jgi:ubiquinone/menaquinone biosynthesis C-methylase UbiE
LRKLVAHTHQQAYDFWARHFDDPALMANRDIETTRFKVAHIAARLPLNQRSRVLDVGPGDGELFRLIAPRTARCCGVDPSESAVTKLKQLFAETTNVEFAVGTSERIPYHDDTFDVVVINSVILILPSREAVERTLAELVRVCTPGGTIYIGEVPFHPEGQGGIPAYLRRKLADAGLRGLARTAYRIYIRPVLRGEPILLTPLSETLYFEPDDFTCMCERHGAEVVCSRNLEIRRASHSRNDYILTLPGI